MARTKRSSVLRVELPPEINREMARLKKEIERLESRNIFESVHHDALKRYIAAEQELNKPALPDLEEGD